jgi:hypothetical protein
MLHLIRREHRINVAALFYGTDTTYSDQSQCLMCMMEWRTQMVSYGDELFNDKEMGMECVRTPSTRMHPHNQVVKFRNKCARARVSWEQI